MVTLLSVCVSLCRQTNPGQHRSSRFSGRWTSGEGHSQTTEDVSSQRHHGFKSGVSALELDEL